jgi:hypothetical protein
MGKRERVNMVTRSLHYLRGPKVTAVSRKQWALLMTTLFVLWIPMGTYLIFVVGPSNRC